jgi:hypothetical protein
MEANLRRIDLARVRWEEYDVVKTLFHLGFETLERFGGAQHPFIISKLGSVVGSEDRLGVYFFGAERQRLFAIQRRIAQASRYVTVLTPQSQALWNAQFPQTHTLLVPGAVDAEIPKPGNDPYPKGPDRRCVYSGSFYSRTHQPEAHAVLVLKMNRLGELLGDKGIRLYVVGAGDASDLDKRFVSHIGPVSYDDSWDYLYHAHAGIVLAFGPRCNDNESTKIYHYLRAGLPIICESGFPNQHLVSEAAFGKIAPYGDLKQMAGLIVAAADQSWDRSAAIQFVLRAHTWDHRAATYDALIKSNGMT